MAIPDFQALMLPVLRRGIMLQQWDEAFFTGEIL
jgi:hypothetical protein